MIRFEPLSVEEANAFVDEGILDFLNERSTSGHVTVDEFDRAKSDQQRDLLPDGVHTVGQRFETIVVDDTNVGRIWFGPLMGNPTDIYIYDIRIEAERRRRGHAREAIELVIAHAHDGGATRVGLTVAEAHHAAVGLYEQLGFTTARSDTVQREMWLEITRFPSSFP